MGESLPARPPGREHHGISGIQIIPVIPVAGVSPDDVDAPTSRSLPTAQQVSPDDVDAPSPTLLQQRIARCRKGSNRRRKLVQQLARLRRREAVRNRNECHRITTDIIRRFGRIAVEKLTIPKMTRSAAGTVEEPGTNVAAKSGLNREILAQTWGLIIQQLRYKAEWAGRELVEVAPPIYQPRVLGLRPPDAAT